GDLVVVATVGGGRARVAEWFARERVRVDADARVAEAAAALEAGLARAGALRRRIDGGDPETLLAVVRGARDAVAPVALAREDDPVVVAALHRVERRLVREVAVARLRRRVERRELDRVRAVDVLDPHLADLLRRVVAAVLVAAGRVVADVERDELRVGRERRIRKRALARREEARGRERREVRERHRRLVEVEHDELAAGEVVVPRARSGLDGAAFDRGEVLS